MAGRMRILNESGDTPYPFQTPEQQAEAEALLQRYLGAGHLAFDHAKQRQVSHLDPDSDVIVVPEIRVG